ncbi:MAG: hypothetical protein ACJAT4_000153 [Granulosicoccus sp.]|jgi:hypothetical protein
MKTILIAVSILLCASFSYAQKSVSKTITTKSGQEVNFDFDRADVKITTWNKNKITISGTAKINNGEDDDAFTIKVKEIDGEWNISTFLENEGDIPRMISMTKDGVTTFKKMDKKNNNWNGWDNLTAQGEEYDHVNIGIITEIKLEIKVPQNIAIKIKSKFGGVDIENFQGELYAKNIHGHINAIFSKPICKDVQLSSTHNFVDVSVPSNSQLNVELKSSHGEMLTDLDLDFQQGAGGKNGKMNSCSSSKNRIVANLNGGGANLKLKATHNNIYLREYKMNN